ncbi:MAG: flagellar biosynthetic protein FliO [Gammaproteobacteria bacterium]|nr:flagellar biosynthetic protein FliO [Gammaproteobacteria bacterium]
MSKIITIIKNTLTMMIIFLSSAAIADEGVSTQSTSIANNEPFAMANILQMLAGLAFVIILILLLGWFYRRFGTIGTNNNSDFRIVASLSMGQRERVVMLQVGHHQILLGVGPGHVEKIHVFDEPVIKESNSSGGSFSDSLAKVISQRGQR